MVGREIEFEQPSLEILGRCRGPRAFFHIRWQSVQLAAVGDLTRPGVGGVEQVLLELRLQRGQVLHQRTEPRLLRRGQRHARETEITQTVLDDLALRRVEPGIDVGDGSIGPEQILVLTQLSAVVAEFGQTAVVGIAQRFGVDYRVHVADGCPYPSQAVTHAFQWFDDAGPACLRPVQQRL